jgi:pimeloyl-ACP methyl ester carboxylesterase
MRINFTSVVSSPGRVELPHVPFNLSNVTQSRLCLIFIPHSGFDAMSSPAEYTVVICHGPFLSSASYSPLVNALKSNGIDAYCPQLATSDQRKLNVGDLNNPDYDREPPEGGYPQGEEDVQVVLSTLHPLIQEQARKVLLVGHGTGGWTATQAAKPELQAKFREANGLSGGIIGILYLGGYIITIGHSITSFLPVDKEKWPPRTLSFFRVHVSSVLSRAMSDPN